MWYKLFTERWIEQIEINNDDNSEKLPYKFYHLRSIKINGSRMIGTWPMVTKAVSRNCNLSRVWSILYRKREFFWNC